MSYTEAELRAAFLHGWENFDTQRSNLEAEFEMFVANLRRTHTNDQGEMRHPDDRMQDGRW